MIQHHVYKTTLKLDLKVVASESPSAAHRLDTVYPIKFIQIWWLSRFTLSMGMHLPPWRLPPPGHNLSGHFQVTNLVSHWDYQHWRVGSNRMRLQVESLHLMLESPWTLFAWHNHRMVTKHHVQHTRTVRKPLHRCDERILKVRMVFGSGCHVAARVSSSIL